MRRKCKKAVGAVGGADAGECILKGLWGKLAWSEEVP